MRKQTGFTLTEMLITIAVGAILVAVAIPSYSNMVEKRKLTGAAELIYTQMIAARAEALKRSRDIPLSFVVGANWQLGYADTGTSCTPGTDCVITDYNNDGDTNDADDNLATFWTSEQYPDTSIAVTATDVVFDWTTGVADTATVVTLTSDNYEMQVQMSVLGRARICSDAGATKVGGYPDC
ncbi:MAG: GspH/FimT family pseudopilin [bacterium]